MNTKQCKPLSKVDQLKRHAPLKQKAVKDKEYLAWFHNQGFCCLVCNNPQIEAHHIKEHSTDLKDDRNLLPLCEWHHRYSDHLSPHGAPSKWRELYPMDKQVEIAERYYKQYKEEELQ